MKILNFYNDIHDYQLERRKKHCTIRLGDKRQKYEEGDIVWVTYGNRNETRRKIYVGAIDRVEYKKIKDLSKDDLLNENPASPTVEHLVAFLAKVYDKSVSEQDFASVIYFSEIVEDEE